MGENPNAIRHVILSSVDSYIVMRPVPNETDPPMYRAVCQVFADYAQARTIAKALDAQAIEARRAETRSGSVHESAVGEADAPNPSPEANPNE